MIRLLFSDHWLWSFVAGEIESVIFEMLRNMGFLESTFPQWPTVG